MAERPEYLTVPEVMARLRLGRTTVYEQARLYLATNGTKGIPCQRFGRSLRFPAAAFDAPSGVSTNNGAEADLADARTHEQPAQPPQPRSLSPSRRPRTARPSSDDDQRSLPFAG
jgi:hypothetical protein